jgi:GDP-L-fucose synthase
MEKNAKIYVAGHRGLVGSALIRTLEAKDYSNLLVRDHSQLDLTDQYATENFFQSEQPDYVFLAAAKVGGILANSLYPAEFIRDNLAIQNSIIYTAYRYHVKRLLFLGSSCIYPKLAPQPLKEDYLLTGPLEPTNRPYALAKIAGIEMCWSYNRQYGTRFFAVMPTNLYGPGDNYDLANSHVLPALIRKMHEAKQRNDATVTLWGSGTPRREFLYSDDMAEACVYLMNQTDQELLPLLDSQDQPPLVNIGCGEDLSIRELAEIVRHIVGFQGDIAWDATKPDGTPQKLLDVSLAHRLGWRAHTDLQTGILAAYRHFLADGIGSRHHD